MYECDQECTHIHVNAKVWNFRVARMACRTPKEQSKAASFVFSLYKHEDIFFHRGKMFLSAGLIGEKGNSKLLQVEACCMLIGGRATS
jgi:hypothetical protein